MAGFGVRAAGTGAGGAAVSGLAVFAGTVGGTGGGVCFFGRTGSVVGAGGVDGWTARGTGTGGGSVVGFAGLPGLPGVASTGTFTFPGCDGTVEAELAGSPGAAGAAGGVALPARFFSPRAIGAAGFAGCVGATSDGLIGGPGLDGLAAVGLPGTADWDGVPGLIPADGSLGFPPRNGLMTFAPAVPAAAGGSAIIPGGLAGAVFAAVPGVSLAIFACNAVACIGSAIPFQPLSNFGAAIVTATGGNGADFLLRDTVGAVIARTPAESCENFPSGVIGPMPSLRLTRTVGTGWAPVRMSALFTA